MRFDDAPPALLRNWNPIKGSTNAQGVQADSEQAPGAQTAIQCQPAALLPTGIALAVDTRIDSFLEGRVLAN